MYVYIYIYIYISYDTVLALFVSRNFEPLEEF